MYDLYVHTYTYTYYTYVCMTHFISTVGMYIRMWVSMYVCTYMYLHIRTYPQMINGHK